MSAGFSRGPPHPEEQKNGATAGSDRSIETGVAVEGGIGTIFCVVLESIPLVEL